MIIGMFPNFDESVLKMLLESNNFNLESTMEALFNMGDQPATGSQPTQSQGEPPAEEDEDQEISAFDDEAESQPLNNPPPAQVVEQHQKLSQEQIDEMIAAEMQLK